MRASAGLLRENRAGTATQALPHRQHRAFQFTPPTITKRCWSRRTRRSASGRLRKIGQWNGNGLWSISARGCASAACRTPPSSRRARPLPRHVARRTPPCWPLRAGARVDAARGLSPDPGVVAEALFGSDVERHTERFAREVATLNATGCARSPRHHPAHVVATPRKTHPRATPTCRRRGEMIAATGRTARIAAISVGPAARHDDEGDGGNERPPGARRGHNSAGRRRDHRHRGAVTLHLLSAHPASRPRARRDRPPSAAPAR